MASLNIDHNSNSGQMMSCNQQLNDYSGIWLSFFKTDGFSNNQHYSQEKKGLENMKKFAGSFMARFIRDYNIVPLDIKGKYFNTQGIVKSA